HHQILQGKYFSHEIFAKSIMGVPQGRVSQTATGAERILERDLSLPFWLQKIFPRLEVSSRNQIGIVNKRRLDVGAENQIVTLRFVGKCQLAAAPLAWILGVWAGQPWFHCDQRFRRSEERRVGKEC